MTRSILADDPDLEPIEQLKTWPHCPVAREYMRVEAEWAGPLDFDRHAKRLVHVSVTWAAPTKERGHDER
jgi:hypothetical protein